MIPGLPTYLGLVQCRHGLMLYPRFDRYVGQSLEKYGEFSQGEIALFQQIVKAGDVIVEIGANLGAHTVPLAKLTGPGGALFAFEPQPVLFQILAANMALNALAWARPFQSGMGNTIGTLKLPTIDYWQDNNFGAFQLAETGAQTVELRTLDSLGIKKLDFLKIDVEGMESAVLEGGRETIARHRPLMYVENDREERSRALIELIARMGYRMWWHFPPLYNAENYFANGENIFGLTVSANMLCVPAERDMRLDLPEVRDAGEGWFQAVNKIKATS